MSDEITIDVSDNIEAISRLHKQVFTDHLLGMLPIKVIQAFYREHGDGKNLFLCAKCGGQVIGFVLGGESSDLFASKKRFLRKNRFRFAWSILVNYKALKLFFQTHIKSKIKLKTGGVKLFRIGCYLFV